MAYFLKKTTLKGRTYLSIVDSFYSHEKKGAAHRVFKSLGSIETLVNNGMNDPIAYYQHEVDQLNLARKEEGVRKVSDESPILHLGYFPLKSIMHQLHIKKYVDYFKLNHSFRYDLYELLASLIYARSVHPCSKHRTFHEVLPRLFEPHHFSYDQLQDGLAFLGNDYEKFIEIFTMQVSKSYGYDTEQTYFDTTNFYFEIDREDDFRRKGPSKENRKEPIIGLGLLLDRHQIPLGMKMFPGNQSEKPILREIISNLKERHHLSGRTIHVADKGLNCAENIAFSKINGDGYIFSKSVKGLPETERVWVLLENDYLEVKDRNGRVLFHYKSCIDQFPYKVEYEGKKTTVHLTEKRIATYNPSLAAKRKYEIKKLVDKALTLSHSQAKRTEYGEASKYVSFSDTQGKKAKVTLNQEAIDKDLACAGYNLLVTSETKMEDIEIYETYHNLWRMEESFRIMKSDLDARPAYARTENTIKGHFLICYLTVLLERIFQLKILKDEYSSSEIFQFIRKFNVTKTERGYINTSTKSAILSDLAQRFNLPLDHYYLSETQIQSILKHKVR